MQIQSQYTVPQFSRQYQRGVGFVGFIMIIALLCALFLIGAKVFPTFVEYRAISGAVKKAASSASTILDIQHAFDRSAVIDDITSITGKDLVVEKAGDGFVVSFAYSKKIPLVDPVSLVIDYAGSSKGL